MQLLRMGQCMHYAVACHALYFALAVWHMQQVRQQQQLQCSVSAEFVSLLPAAYLRMHKRRRSLLAC
jgi:hypothetical protein